MTLLSFFSRLFGNLKLFVCFLTVLFAEIRDENSLLLLSLFFFVEKTFWHFQRFWKAKRQTSFILLSLKQKNYKHFTKKYKLYNFTFVVVYLTLCFKIQNILYCFFFLFILNIYFVKNPCLQKYLHTLNTHKQTKTWLY